MSADDGFTFTAPDEPITPAMVAEAEAQSLAELRAEWAAQDAALLEAEQDTAEPEPPLTIEPEPEPDAEDVLLTDEQLDAMTPELREWWAWGDHPELTSPQVHARKGRLSEYDHAHRKPRVSDPELLWDARPWLTALRDFARDELASPWAVLGAVLALASAHVAPNVVLPPRRGNGLPGAVGSLNIFSVLAGPPGSNKSVAVDVAATFLDVTGGVSVRRAGPGSGEGIVAAFGAEDAQVPGGFRYRTMSLLLHADEITGLDAMMRRTSSTLLPFLRTAWSAGDLSTLNAEAGRQRFVPKHAYRLAMTIGVQPGNAGALLGDADGGLPQRLLWFSAVDPEVGAHPDSGTGPWPWTVPTSGPMLVPDPAAPSGTPRNGGPVPMLPVLGPQQQIGMPQDAFDAYRAAAVAAGRGEGDALDGHAAQARGRVTALLALLDGRTIATADDWDLAGMVMAHSDATRAAMVAAVAAETARANESRGRADGVRAAVADIARDDAVQRRAGSWALDRLQRAQAEGADGMTGSELSRACSSTIRGGLQDALEALEAAGQVTAEQFEHNGQPGVRYRAARGSR